MKKKKLYNLFVIFQLLAGFIFTFGIIYSTYIKKSIFSGPFSIEISGISTRDYTIEALSPRGQVLQFQRTAREYYDSAYRAIGTFKLIISLQKEDTVKEYFICINRVHIIKKTSNNDNIIVLYKGDFPAQNNMIKLIYLFLFFYKTYTFVFIGLLIACVLLATILMRKTILRFGYLLYNKLNQTPLPIVIIWATACTIVILFFKPVDFSDRVVSNHSPDQIDYQNMAVNLSLGYGFNISGKISETTDYKTICTDKHAEKLNFIKGKRFDRFPAYSLIIGVIYSIFGNHPVIIKYFQLFLVTLIVAFLPLISKYIWGNNGLYGGVIAAPLLFFYLYEYVPVLLPDIFTVFINIIVFALYIKFRKEKTLKFALLLGVISGISILLRSSLIIFFVFMFIDLSILIFRNNCRAKWTLLIILFFSFTVVWIPYNIRSMHLSYKNKQSAKVIINKVTEPLPDLKEINQLIKEQSPYDAEFNVTENDLIRFNREIMPFFQKYKFVRLAGSDFSKGLEKLIMFLYAAKHSHVFFMLQYHGTTGLLDINNEFVNDGMLSDEWTRIPTSHYNNDGLSQKSELIRTINFYNHYPEKLVTITAAKLRAYFSKNFILPVFIVMVIILMMVIFYERIRLQKKVFYLLISLFILLSFVVIALLNDIFFSLALLISFIILLTDKQLRKCLPLPLIFLTISLFLFPVITYGNPRYLIYYDTLIFALCGTLMIEIILKFFHVFKQENTSN